MFKKLTFTWLFVTCVLSLKAQVTDNFSDGDFTVAPVWTPSAPTDFKDTLGMLRSNNTTASSTYYITTPSTTATNAQWEFYINLKFATSSANYVDVYLTADNANLTSATLNGYFVRIGNTLDEICLYKNVAGTTSKIIDGADGIVTSSSNNLIKVKVKRDASNLFTLERDMTGTGSTFTLEGSVVDGTFTTSAFFGFLIKQSTASFFKKHFIDDVYAGPIILDTAPPTIVSATATSATTVDVLFSEALGASTSATATNYTINSGIGTPITATLDGVNTALVHLTLSTTMVNMTTYQLIVDNVDDVSGNAMDNDTINFLYFISDTADYRDVVINEFLADESPQVGMPAAEFIELYNRSTKYFDLAGWKLSDGSSTATLGTRILAPGQYLILCANGDTTDYKLFGPTLGVSSFPSLNNSGDNITLQNQLLQPVDAITYDLTWYQDALKDDGGYSLEQKNPNANCSNAANWSASNDVNGGTPGTVNSIFSSVPDTQAPQIASITVNTNIQLTVTFTEAIDAAAVGTVSFSLLSGPSVTFWNVSIIDYMSAQITLGSPLDSGLVYTLIASNLTDCEGNGPGTYDSSNFMLPFSARAGDIVLNEVLFNPTTGVSDFVEIYNNSTKALNLKDWTFANIDNDTIDNHKIISAVDLLLGPGEYYAFTTDKSALISYYTQAAVDRVIEIPSLPSYNNDSSTVLLITANNQVSDRFSYIEEEMQFPLLQSYDGVSLERLDFNRPTQDKTNWHSAAEEAGFATPGYVNSQYNPAESSGAVLTLDRDIFSPDNDGYQDVINFNYTMAEAGYVGNATVYDAKGRLIKKLMQNEMLAAKGTFVWDGINDKNEKAATGIYVLYFEYFNLNGEVKKVKKSFVLATKF